MASELKPCPFCGGNNLNTYYCDIEDWIAHIKCDDCDDMIGPMSEYKYESQEEAYEDAATRWNTRPAPAATDTGLVRYDLSMFGNGIVEMGGGAYVLADQADELLAAKDAQIAGWTESGKLWTAEIRELQADNAAKDARIKELDRCHEGTIDLCNQKTAQIKALEAKLAAAEKALEPFAKELSERHDKIFRLEPAPDSECVGFTQLTYGHFREARAALGGKPS